MARKKLKVVMLGEGRVGKTSLLHRFVHNSFDEECPSTTKATMYANTKVEVGETTADVSVWDTAGQERYHALGPIYYRDAHGAVLAYDITDKDSFDKVKVWLKELHQVVGENINVVVVGNKCDLERERKVVKKEAEEWAAAHGAQHFLCSAKLGIRVADAFTALVTAIVKSLGTASGVQAGTGNGANAGAYNGGRPASSNQRSKGVKIAPDEGPAREAPPEKKDCSC
ncbi:ras-related GTP-binding protein, putative [Bodo saltans]|uniref:Ras-related GTP-binding protein, putative n=1 Tax=Bodo saltans TaxID=75058 RepID=A0A0S4JKI9_BODSA|nr:ras-related GTP-binding protein, putative [Bodo saltans]|eukprot:CUG89696.1 ras-related GTP-binding protein, putative [Bodo saltans]